MAYKNSVFLNVPLDRRYKRLFEAAVLAIYNCGLEVEALGNGRPLIRYLCRSVSRARSILFYWPGARVPDFMLTPTSPVG